MTIPESNLELVWSPIARQTFDRMPVEVQRALLDEFLRMAIRSQPLYRSQNWPACIDSVGSLTHIQVPDWNIWLRIDKGYLEDQGEPLLFINELEELTKAELEASVAAACANSDPLL